MSGLSSKWMLMLAMLATGMAGIVAEYILATLATYFLGDSVFQWTIILSLMLFSMGLGSRVSRWIKTNLEEWFIGIEFTLSVLTSLSSGFVYLLMPHVSNLAPSIYILAIVIGILIGMEIPLVTRINSINSELRTNISEVMEKDYFGALIGGLFFAFIGIRYLGITYTPFVVGAVNLAVAIMVFLKFKKFIDKKNIRKLFVFASSVVVLIGVGLFFSKNLVLYANQNLYTGQVVYSKQTPYQQITLTKWKEHHWLYLNQGKQLSTFDEWMYHEPLVHPAMQLAANPKHILVMGAGDGCAIREILKYPNVEKITLVDLDPAMTDVGKNHPILRKVNQDAFWSPKLEVVNTDAFTYLEQNNRFFDVIIADFPDPRSIDLSRLYSKEMYSLVYHRLSANGVFVTQAASPYYTTQAFRCIEKTLQAAKFNVLPLRNHIYTFGEWGWMLATKKLPTLEMKNRIVKEDWQEVATKFLTKEASTLITSFGQDLIQTDSAEIKVNSIYNPVLYRYYGTGNWSYYF
jgi:spermidine synthase